MYFKSKQECTTTIYSRKVQILLKIPFNFMQIKSNQIKIKKKTEIQKPRKKKKTKCKTRVYIICIFIEYSIYK